MDIVISTSDTLIRADKEGLSWEHKWYRKKRLCPERGLPMKYAPVGLFCALAILWGVISFFHGATVAEEGRVAFGDGLDLPYRIINEGGALGNVRYQVFAEREGGRDKIFEGVSGEEFRIIKAGPQLIRIRFCNGLVKHVPAVDAVGRHARVLVQADIHCSKGK